MGLEDVDPQREQDQFFNRVNVSIFRWLEESEHSSTFWHEKFIWWISERMGESWGDQVHQRDFGDGYWFPLTLKSMSQGDFYKTLEILENCHLYIKEGKAQEFGGRSYCASEDRVIIRNFEERMERIMLLSGAQVGVFWKDGKFYPAGALELDEALIKDTLEWLEAYPKVKKQFEVALKHYEGSLQDISAGKDALTNAYTSMEYLAQQVLENSKNFEKNSDEFVRKIKLPTEYGNIIHYYKQLAHEYGSRHAGSDPKHEEVEAFIYMTGLLLRLATKPR